MRHIVITGPECSGKTTLAASLAQHFGTRWVEEGARAYLENKPGGPGYDEATLRDIAEYQLALEDKTAAEIGPHGPQLLFHDTDLITIRIWGEEKYGRSDAWIMRMTEERPYDLWLLCAPDMPWQFDPLRENPHDRDRLFNVYERTLQQLRKPYVVMHGSPAERLEAAVRAVNAVRS